MDSRQKHAGMTDSIHPVNGYGNCVVIIVLVIQYSLIKYYYKLIPKAQIKKS